MQSSKVYLSFGRHERYGHDTAIERRDMLIAYQTGKILRSILPTCETVYHSPLARAVETARFEALGLECSHLIESEFLNEGAPKYTIQKFLNNLLENVDTKVKYYHFVTHLPVVEKLGLPFLGAGDVCLLCADNWSEMLSENFHIQVISTPKMPLKLWQKINISSENFDRLTADEIYFRLQEIAKSGDRDDD